MSAESLIMSASILNIDGIIITEHNHIWSKKELLELMSKIGDVGILVLRGQEISCNDGHLLVYNFDYDVNIKGSRVDVSRIVRGSGGATVLPHPFRWNGFAGWSVERMLDVFDEFDAVEALTTNHNVEEQNRAINLQNFGIKITGASDAHSEDRVGMYATEFGCSITDEIEFAMALKSTQFKPVKLRSDI